MIVFCKNLLYTLKRETGYFTYLKGYYAVANKLIQKNAWNGKPVTGGGFDDCPSNAKSPQSLNMTANPSHVWLECDSMENLAG